MLSIKLKDLRMKSNITQRQFAEILKVSAGTVGNWESGTREPDLVMLKKIANYFNVSTDYLLDNENNIQTNRNNITNGYSTEEQQLIEDFRSLTPELKKRLLKQ